MRSVPVRAHYPTGTSSPHLRQRARTQERGQCSSGMKRSWMVTEAYSLKVRNLGESYVKP